MPSDNRSRLPHALNSTHTQSGERVALLGRTLSAHPFSRFEKLNVVFLDFLFFALLVEALCVV